MRELKERLDKNEVHMLTDYMKSKYKGNSFPLATVKMQNSWCCHAGDVKYKTRAAANAWWQEGLLYTFEKHCRQDASTHAYITSKRDDHFCFSICSYITCICLQLDTPYLVHLRSLLVYSCVHSKIIIERKHVQSLVKTRSARWPWTSALMSVKIMIYYLPCTSGFMS